jgi:hypothetical protein
MMAVRSSVSKELVLLLLSLTFLDRLVMATTNNNNVTDASILCELVVFVPFSYNQTIGMNFGSDGLLEQVDTDNPSSPDNINNLGFSQMAAAILAVEHFQTRSTSVVQRSSYVDENGNDKCPNLELSIRGVYDTSMTELGGASKALLQQDLPQHEHRLPCAFVLGAYSKQRVDLEFEGLSTGYERPLLMYRNYQVEAALFAPYSNSIFPDIVSISRALGSFLEYKGRTDYVAILYNRLGDAAAEWTNTVSLVLGGMGIEYRRYGYRIPESFEEFEKRVHVEKVDLLSPNDSMEAAMVQLREEGFRTIIIVMEYPAVEFPIVAEAADVVGLNTEGYFWNFVGTDASLFFYPNITAVTVNSLRLLVGGALFSPLEGFLHDQEDPFLKVWRDTNDPSLINAINDFHNVPHENSGYYQAGSDYFQRFLPAPGAGYAYDSVMAAALGACDVVSGISAINDDNNITIYDIPADVHLQAIRQLNFSGATSRSIFMDSNVPGSVHPSSPTYGVMNLFPYLAGEDEKDWYDLLRIRLPNSTQKDLYTITHILNTNEGRNSSWQELLPFVFSSGKTTPPPLLRSTADQLYLKKGARITGLTLMAIAKAGCVAAAVWLFVNRQTRTVRASQPSLMLCICAGSFVEASAIFFVSVDESYGWSQSGLDKACSAIPWLAVLGHVFTYSSLFAKVRAKKISGAGFMHFCEPSF